jgi:hypothetical protein
MVAARTMMNSLVRQSKQVGNEPALGDGEYGDVQGRHAGMQDDNEKDDEGSNNVDDEVGDVITHAGSVAAYG